MEPLQFGLPAFDVLSPLSQLFDPLELRFADLLDMHLVGALTISPTSISLVLTHVGVSQRPQTRVHICQGLVLADPFCTMYLHRPVYHLERHTRYGELLSAQSTTAAHLCQADLLQSGFRAVQVYLPRGCKDEQSSLIDLRPAVCDIRQDGT